jgi:hypothetical protein
MNAMCRLSGLVTLVVILAAGIVIGMNVVQPAISQAQPVTTPGGRYLVVHTEGTNLIVTDNKTNMLYFYTTDKGAEPGADLKLRGTLDLSKVGNDVLKPKLHNKQ